MVSILPWIMLGIVPVTIVYWMLLRYYRQTGNDLQRLDAVSRSPVQSMVSEAMDGAASIRTFRQTNCFTERFYKAVDQNSSALLCFVSAQRWLAFRIEILGSLIVLISSVLVISMNDSLGIDAGLAGLLVSCNAFNRYSTLSFRSKFAIAFIIRKRFSGRAILQSRWAFSLIHSGTYRYLHLCSRSTIALH